MKNDFFNFKQIIIAGIILVAAAGLISFVLNKELRNNTPSARAGTEHAISGFAWSPNIGWISFNATNCDSDCTGATCISEGGAGCPTAGQNYSNYGVDLGSNGIFNGYAWSNNVGWIYFGPDATLPVYGLTQDDDAPNPPKTWGTLNYSGTTAEISGWAKILSMGDNGWIKFSDDSITDWNGLGLRIADTNIGEISGWAWNNNDDGTGIGWISFNADNCNNNGSTYDGTPSECPPAGTNYYPYNVIIDPGALNHAPEITDMSAPNIAEENYCEETVKRAFLQWVFSDSDAIDTQSGAYQIIFDDDNDPADPIFDTGKCVAVGNPTVECLSAANAESYVAHNATTLNYGVHYYWWLKVWDERGLESELYSSTDFGADFIIPASEYPDPYFTWIPSEFSVGEAVKFIDDISKYYIGSDDYDCDQGACWVEWEFSNGIDFPNEGNADYNTASSAITSFSSVDGWSATSTITDANGYSCSTTTSSDLNLKLPSWIESK